MAWYGMQEEHKREMQESGDFCNSYLIDEMPVEAW